jgi:hypothetical protein
VIGRETPVTSIAAIAARSFSATSTAPARSVSGRSRMNSSPPNLGELDDAWIPRYWTAEWTARVLAVLAAVDSPRGP